MKRWIALLLAGLLVLSLAACGKTSGPSLAEQMENRPAAEQPPEPSEPKPAEPAKPEQTETKEESKPEPKPKPEQKPEEPVLSGDYTAYDGLYRAKEPGEEDEITYVVVRGFEEFLLLEYFNTYEGSTYSFWVEEFWPDEPGIDGTKAVQQGRSQNFSLMSMGDMYSDLPIGCTIALTRDGITVQYDGEEKAAYVRDEEYGGYHSSEETLMAMLQDLYPVEVLDAIVGTWEFWDGWYSANITLEEDGGFHLLSKEKGKPVHVVDGVWGVNPETNLLEVVAEAAGEGQMPCFASLEWSVDESGDLCLEDAEQALIRTMGNRYAFWWNEGLPQVNMTQKEALGYVSNEYDLSDTYTDQYDDEYYYTYRLPRLLGWSDEANEVNEEIMECFVPIIEDELAAMERGEFLTTETVQYELYQSDHILMIHIYTYSYMMNEIHAVYYWNTETNTRTDSSALLKQLGISEKEFLDAVRDEAEACFISYCSGVPEKEREDYGYYEFLEWTVSEEAVNLDLPMYVNDMGELCVYAKIGSLAGPSYFWEPIYPFADFEAEG